MAYTLRGRTNHYGYLSLITVFHDSKAAEMFNLRVDLNFAFCYASVFQFKDKSTDNRYIIPASVN